MKLNEIYEYFRRRHVHLCFEKYNEDCPYKEIYKDRSFCTISDFLVVFYLGGKYQKEISYYIKKACYTVRQELLEDQTIREEARIRQENLLNNTNVGDRVFCIPKCDDVFLLEKNADFSGRCRCKTLDGDELLVFPFDLNPISKGNKYSVYKSKNFDKMLEFNARKL